MLEMLEKTAAALRKRGFDASVFSSSSQAAAFLLSDIPEGEPVAIGGSMTAKQMGLERLLRQSGHKVLWHWEATPEERPALLHEAMQTSFYICSANALTESGLIVQIDGNGNRIAAMCYGPKTVYLVIGRNKIVKGGYQDAVRRIKQTACPQNARRQHLLTPCGKEGGACSVAQCSQSMCHITAAFDLAPSGKRTQVLLIDEDLGY